MQGIRPVNGHSVPDYKVQGGFPGQVFCMHCGFVWPKDKCPERPDERKNSVLYQFLKDNKTEV